MGRESGDRSPEAHDGKSFCLPQKENGEDARGVFTVLKLASGALGALLASFRGAVATGEFLDPAGGIDEFLLAGKERMAGRADTDLDVALGGTSAIISAAGATDDALVIVGMNICFHGLEKGVGR